MAKKRSIEDRFFPVAMTPRLNQPSKPTENQMVIKKIIQGAIQGAYRIKTPRSYDFKYNSSKALVTEEQVQFVTYLIESLQPKDAIEATLASQYVISYLRGLDASPDGDIDEVLPWFEFGHRVLETLTKYRKQGQINNFKVVEKDNSQPIIEVN